MSLPPSSFADQLNEAYKNYQAPKPIPSLEITPIQNKTWGDECESNDKLNFKWMFDILTFNLSYKGTMYHEFEASILDTSNDGKRSFSICLKDPTTDDLSNSVRKEKYGLNLQDYVRNAAQTSFKILRDNGDGSASIIGRVNFPK